MRIPADTTAADSRTIRLLPFYLGNEAFCVDMQSLRSIERSDLLQLSPGGEPFGWLLGHEEIPVVNAGAELFPERRYASAGRILIFDAADHRVALLVGRVSRAFEAEASAVRALPPVARDPRGRVTGVVARDENLYLLIEPLILAGAGPESAEPESAGDADGPAAEGRRPAGEEPDATASRQGQLVSFSTRWTAGAAMRYGLSLRQVAEISPPAPVVPVPDAPAWLLGLVSWRQRPVAVVDLDRRLGEQSRPPLIPPRGQSAAEPERLLVAWTGQGSDVVAFPVRKDLRVHKLPLEYQTSYRELDLDRSLTRGVFELADTPLVVPDLRKVVTAKSPPLDPPKGTKETVR